MSSEAQVGCGSDHPHDGTALLSDAAVSDDGLHRSRRSGSELQHRSQVGRRVRVRRVWADLSQEDVAQRAQVTRNFVSAIERGAQGLDAWRLWAVADALGVRLEWLLTGPDDVLPGEG